MEYLGQPEVKNPGWGRAKHSETGEVIDIFDPIYERDETALPPGRYEHYKSTAEAPRHYAVELVVRNTETGERLVIYEPLYETDTDYRWARPLDMFLETVEHEGTAVPRFRFIEP